MDPEKLTLRRIFLSLTSKQAWGILTIAGVCFAAFFTFGVFVQDLRNERQLAEVENELSSANQRIVSLNNKLSEADSEKNALRTTISAYDTLQEQTDAKARFLSQYITYLRSKTPTAEKVFVDLVCAMWREDQKFRVSVQRRPLDIGISGNSKISTKERELMVKAGVSPQLIANLENAQSELRRAPRTEPVGALVVRKANVEPLRRRVDRAGSQLSDAVQQATLSKIVTFSESESYVLPDEIAVAVHNSPNCAP